MSRILPIVIAWMLSVVPVSRVSAVVIATFFDEGSFASHVDGQLVAFDGIPSPPPASVLGGAEYAGSGLVITQLSGLPINVVSYDPGSPPGHVANPAFFGSLPNALSSSTYYPGGLPPAEFDDAKDDNFRFEFTPAVGAAGLYVGQLDVGGSSATDVSFIDENGAVIQAFHLSRSTAPAGTFVGIISTVPIKRIETLEPSGDADTIFWDDIRFGSSKCGNGLVEVDEECDLGTATATSGNCPAGTCTSADSCDPACIACTRSCTVDCKVRGRCTASGNCCTAASDCPSGEGCCGNGITENPEQCDDGNLAGGDACTPQCTSDVGLPSLCCPRGSEIAGATVLVRKKVKLTRLGPPAGDDQVKSGGEAILLPGQEVRPCTEGVSYCLEGAAGILYGQDDDDGIPGPDPISSNDPQVRGDQFKAPCVDASSPRRVRAAYKDTGRPPVGSDPDGMKQISFKNVTSQPNKFKFKVLLRDVDLSVASGQTQLRQTIVIGDTCWPLNLACSPAGTTTAICVPTP